MRHLPPPFPRPLFRWQLGALFLSLPRRFIAGRFREVAASCPDKLIPYPVGNARSRQLRRLPYQRVMVRSQSDSYGGGVGAVFFFSRSSHAG
jgi:hypothetical protein